jgi:ribosomal-protein-alanine N-acetyltransferase
LHYTKIKILKAQLKELDQILYIEKSSFNDMDQFSKNTFKYFIKKRRLWIVKLDKTIVGYFILICYKKSIRIYSIALLPKYRNQGIGSKILSFIIKLAVFLKKYKIILEVRTSNISKKLYERFGFKVKKILKNYYENEDGYKMELLLKERR